MKRATPLYVVGLLGAGVIAGALVRPLSARMGVTAPQVSWGPATMLFAFSLFVFAIAWSTWQSLHKRHERMTSDHGVKMLALSRSCLIVGGLFGGAYGGYALSFLRDVDTLYGAARVWHAGGASLAGIVLVVAALLLERACRIPGSDDEDPEVDGAAASAA